jgi:hypothetical protein
LPDYGHSEKQLLRLEEKALYACGKEEKSDQQYPFVPRTP